MTKKALYSFGEALGAILENKSYVGNEYIFTIQKEVIEELVKEIKGLKDYERNKKNEEINNKAMETL